MDISTFIAIDRTRSLMESKRVVSIERSRVPYLPELHDLPLRGLAGGSLSETLRKAGLIAESGEEQAEVECLSSADAGIGGKPEGTPFLHTRRLVRDGESRVIKYVVSLLDPKHFALHLDS